MGVDPDGTTEHGGGIHSGASGKDPLLNLPKSDPRVQKLKDQFDAETARRQAGQKPEMSQKEYNKLKKRIDGLFGRHHRPEQQKGNQPKPFLG